MKIQKELLELGLSLAVQEKLLHSLLALALLIFAHRIISRFLVHRVKSHDVLYRSQKILLYTAYFCAFIFLTGIWYTGTGSIATYFGLLSAGLAVAFKDYLANIAGWFHIFWKEPFKAGHRVQIGNIIGDVLDIGASSITLLEIANASNSEQPTGRIVFLPNSRVFTDLVANYDHSFPFIWHEIDVVVTFESDWRKAKAIVDQVVRTHSKVYDEQSIWQIRRDSKNLLLPELFTDPIIFTAVVDQGVSLSGRFVCDPRIRRSVEREVWEEILDRFSKEDTIDFAYPTYRYYNNPSEGKAGAGGLLNSKKSISESVPRD